MSKTPRADAARSTYRNGYQPTILELIDVLAGTEIDLWNALNKKNVNLDNQSLNNMTFKGLINSYDRYVGRTVIFQKDIDETDTCFDPFQKAILGNFELDDHSEESVQIVFYFKPYLDFNRPLLKPSYYDKDGVPYLTAEQANKLPKSGYESWYFEMTDPVEKYFKFEEVL